MRSPRLVKPVTSQNSTVTVLRTRGSAPSAMSFECRTESGKSLGVYLSGGRSTRKTARARRRLNVLTCFVKDGLVLADVPGASHLDLSLERHGDPKRLFRAGDLRQAGVGRSIG